MKRAAGARRQDQRALLDIFLSLVLGVGQRLAQPPIVAHLVIVPLREDRNFGIEGEQVLVEQIVLVVGAELGQRLRRLGLFLHHDVFPDFAVGHFLLGQDWAVGVNVVAVVDEEIGAVAQHGRVGAHAAARFVDAPALAGGVARPHERDGALVVRCGAKAAGHRLADNGRRKKILETDAVEDVLPAGRPSMSALAVKSVSGSASTKTAWRMVLKLSDVATSASMRAGRSARAQITAESSETSPDWMPWVMTGRSAARLR